MALYRPPGIPLGQRIAQGSLPPQVRPSVLLENALPSPYALSRLGIVSESELVAPRTQAGDLISTSRGDHVRELVTVIDPARGTSEREVIRVDVGLGDQSLLTVDDGSIEDDEVVIFSEAPVNESAPFSDPATEPESASYYVPPEVSDPEGGSFIVEEVTAAVSDVAGFIGDVLSGLLDIGGGVSEPVYDAPYVPPPPPEEADPYEY